MMRIDGELSEETPEESDQKLTACSFSLVCKSFPFRHFCEKKEEKDLSVSLVIINLDPEDK